MRNAGSHIRALRTREQRESPIRGIIIWNENYEIKFRPGSSPFHHTHPMLASKLKLSWNLITRQLSSEQIGSHFLGPTSIVRICNFLFPRLSDAIILKWILISLKVYWGVVLKSLNGLKLSVLVKGSDREKDTISFKWTKIFKLSTKWIFHCWINYSSVL